MGFFGWTITILFLSFLFFNLFGKHILRLIIKFMAKRAMKDMQNKSRHYEDIFRNGPMDQQVYSDDDIRVTMAASARQKKEKKETFSDVEEVEFEEFND